jgi:hypothetical protein
MMTMHRLATVLPACAAAVALTVLGAPPACACDCPKLSEADAFARADTVFSGTVVDRREPGGFPRSSADPVTVVLEVSAVYKGEASRRQGVTTPASGASCGIEVEQGRTYLVFADGPGDRLVASLCGGTRARPSAVPAVAVAGAAGQAPAGGPDADTGGTGTEGGGSGPSSVEAAGAGAVLVAAATAGVFAVRRRRRAA